MKESIASALPYIFVLMIACILIGHVLSERFFGALTRAQPDLRDSFRPNYLLVSNADTVPAKYRYLKSKSFNPLPDPSLRRSGLQAYMSLVVYPWLVAAFMLSLVVTLVSPAGH